MLVEGKLNKMMIVNSFQTCESEIATMKLLLNPSSAGND